MAIFQLNSYQLSGKYLAIDWTDGHESLLSISRLRDECPCANCQGEPDLFGRIHRPEQTHSKMDRSYELVDVRPVGRYGVQLTWGDGHSTGIYSFDYLRDMCDCDQCRMTNAMEA